MHICPACQRAAIPVWRAVVMPAFAENTCRCPACQTLVRQRHGASDVIGYLPVLATVWFAFTQADTHALFFVMWALFMSVVAGISLWALTIRYDTVDETLDQFKPHTTQLRF